MKNNFIKNFLGNKQVFLSDISPFLFISKNLEILNLDIKNLISELFSTYGVNKINLHILEDNSEKIKIEEIRNFLNFSFSKNTELFRVFFIENISRLTLSASNSLLKFLEEPGFGNLIFLTNKGEGDVLDTILSRVKIINNEKDVLGKDDFYFDMISSYFLKKDPSFLTFIYSKSLEKNEVLLILKNILLFISQSFEFIDKTDIILNEISLIEKNNINPKNGLDKILLELN